MSIRKITTDELRRMNGQEALILQGCGGDLQEWVDGVNDLLTQEGILQDGTAFSDCMTFRNEGLTCLVFPCTEDVKLDMGRLAMWRLSTYGAFAGTWLSDYVENRLGEHEAAGPVKPDCQLIGQDGNVFNLMGIAARTLRENDMAAEAQEMTNRILHGAGSYEEALGIIGEYVNITGPDEDFEEGPVMEE